jgi:hypothetical protein
MRWWPASVADGHEEAVQEVEEYQGRHWGGEIADRSFQVDDIDAVSKRPRRRA